MLINQVFQRKILVIKMPMYVDRWAFCQAGDTFGLQSITLKPSEHIYTYGTW